MPRQLVRTALKATSLQIQEACLLTEPDGLGFIYSVQRNAEMQKDIKLAVWNLLEKNMRQLYTTSSFGWSVRTKRAELFHKLSRFILVFEGSASDAANLIAFTMFRFEHEEEENVVYCYELQVQERMRGMGIGRNLLHLLELVGGKWQMDKIMLTALKANTKALKFYHDFGVGIDEASPINFGFDVDYVILSKQIGRESAEHDAPGPE